MRLAGRSWHPLPAALALALSLSLGGGMAAHAGSGTSGGDAAGIARTLVHAVVPCPPGWEGRIAAEPGEKPLHRPSAENEAGNARVSTMSTGNCDPEDLADF